MALTQDARAAAKQLPLVATMDGPRLPDSESFSDNPRDSGFPLCKLETLVRLRKKKQEPPKSLRAFDTISLRET